MDDNNNELETQTVVETQLATALAEIKALRNSNAKLQNSNTELRINSAIEISGIVNDAFSTEQLLSAVSPMSSIDDEGNVVASLDGETYPMSEAVEKLSNTLEYHYLFKKHLSQEIGGTAEPTEVKIEAKSDYSKMSYADYQLQRKR